MLTMQNNYHHVLSLVTEKLWEMNKKKKKLKIKTLTYVRFDSWEKQKPRACLEGGGGEGRGWGQFNEPCLDVSVKDLRGFGGYLTNPNPSF